MLKQRILTALVLLMTMAQIGTALGVNRWHGAFFAALERRVAAGRIERVGESDSSALRGGKRSSPGSRRVAGRLSTSVSSHGSK